MRQASEAWCAVCCGVVGCAVAGTAVTTEQLSLSWSAVLQWATSPCSRHHLHTSPLVTSQQHSHQVLSCLIVETPSTTLKSIIVM